MKQNTSLFYFLVALLSLSVSQGAYAHKVNVFAYAENGQVFVEGYFADGKTAPDSAVTVYDAADAVVFEGKTNEAGTLVFTSPANVSSDLRIVLNAGMGHQGQYLIPVNEFGVVEGADVVAESVAPAGVSSQSQALVAAPNQAAIDALVKTAVSEAIKPLVRELAASREHASMTQIVGGIGYILGLLGLFAYLKARQQMAQENSSN